MSSSHCAYLILAIIRGHCPSGAGRCNLSQLIFDTLLETLPDPPVTVKEKDAEGMRSALVFARKQLRDAGILVKWVSEWVPEVAAALAQG